MPADQSPVRRELVGRIAIVTIDNPPVNAGSAAVRAGLIAAIAEIANDPEVDAGVLIGAGKTFVAGSDIREFDGPIAEPQMPRVVAAIDACPKPIVAAIHGAALGGGYEIALACDGRVATRDAVVGLPEVKLGFIPGAGGTQRLPRLIGLPAATEVITSARYVRAPEALALGMVDEIVSDLRDGAVAFARKLGGSKQRISARAVPPGDPAPLRGRAGKAAQAALETIALARTLPFDEALVRERERFQALRTSPESAALRHLFFAERAALRAFGEKSERPIEIVGIVGAGRMGAGIAASLAAAGLKVLVTDQTPEAAEAGVEQARQFARRTAEREGTPLETQMTAGIAVAPAVADLGRCDLVIEAAFEDMVVKQSIFTTLDAVLPPGAIIASNTSYLDIDALAAVTERADAVAGLHFFNPAHVMRLVEIVRGSATSTATLSTLARLVTRMKKLPVLAGNADGFIGNRIFAAYRAQCEFLLEEGAYPQEIDAAMTDFGMAMGPFEVFDLAGLDIAAARRKRLAPTRAPQARYVEIPDHLVAAGRLGRKTGAGWYAYPAGKGRPEADPIVLRMIEEASAKRGIERRLLSPGEICGRLLAAMINEAAHVLADGVAGQASDIDLVLVNGYGFPSEKGGPLYWAAHQPTAPLLASIEAMVAASGYGYERARNLEDILATYR